MEDLCGVAQGLMGCLNRVYSGLLSMRCSISERNNTLLYEATVLKYN